MAMPSNTEPPGELIRTRRFGAVIPRRSAMNWSAVEPYQPPISSYSITSASSGSVALRDAVPGLRFDAVLLAELVGLLALAGDERGEVRGQLHSFCPFRPRLTTLQRQSLPYSAPTQWM
jgi:hypothetical protein